MIDTKNLPAAQPTLIKEEGQKIEASLALLLLKMTADENSRTYLDFVSEKDAIYGVLKFYEVLLNKKNPGSKVLAYTVSDIFEFIDLMQDVALLTYDPAAKNFVPHGKEYIKAKIVELHNVESK